MKQQQLLFRISQIFFLALMGISLVLMVVFYLNTGNINSADPLSARISQMGPILNTFVLWTAILIGLAVVFALGFPVISMISNPKAGLKALVSIGILALVMFVAYQLGDDTLLELAGYTGPDNVPTRLKLTDMILFSVYGMVIAAVLAILFGQFRKLLK